MMGIKLEDLRADQNLNLPPRLPKTALIRAVDLRSERDLDGSKGMVHAHIIAQIKIPKVQIFLRNFPLVGGSSGNRCLVPLRRRASIAP